LALMRFLLAPLLMLSFTVFGSEELLLKNEREGKSFYSSVIDQQILKQARGKMTSEEAVLVFNEVLKNEDLTNLCSYTLNAELEKKIREQSSKITFKGYLYLVREAEQIDDVSLKLLLHAHKVINTPLRDKNEDDYILPFDTEKRKEQLLIIGSFEKRFAQNSCFDAAYRSYYNELLKTDKQLKSYQLEALHFLALKEGRISELTYQRLEQARLNELESGNLTLAGYYQKLKTLRIQYPLRDKEERSHFVSSKAKKIKLSRRQKLFEHYTDLQIILMGNVIKRLRERLEYDAVDITGYKEGVVQEVISLEAMERFRFALKILRKEMSLLSLNTYFNGRSPDYIDLMVASYELGIIPASELDTIASLEEIWNPKKTMWDKASIWVRTFGTMATILIPPPWGFLPALAIVVIEATTGKNKKKQTEDVTSLF
jgi:hypothetical protein